MTKYQVRLPESGRPEGFVHDGYQLRRQAIEDTEADYLAVMRAREHLRKWSGDPWPEDDFTVEQNREDLDGHLRDAAEGFAFGYTVWDKDRRTVLGSVYLYPPAYFAGRYRFADPERTAMLEAGVLVDYWLDPEFEDSPRHADFLRGILAWLAEKWGFSRVVWSTRPAMEERRALYEREGFRPLGAVESLSEPGWIQWYHISTTNSGSGNTVP